MAPYGMSSFHSLPLELIQNHSTGLYVPHKERTSHIFGNVRCPILAKRRTPLQLPGCRHERKAEQMELGIEDK